MKRTEALCRFLGWQGGTVHQVSQITGVNSTDVIYGEAVHDEDYLNGWWTGRDKNKDKALRRRGNVQFWLGVAEGFIHESTVA